VSLQFWNKPANLLTLARLCAAPAIAGAVVLGHVHLAALLFVGAVVTDFADGPLARRRSEASTFGGLFDHATDALFVTGLLAALAWRGLLTPLLPVLVVVAFLQYLIDSDALRGRRLRTSRIGRSNGVGYYVAAGVPVIRDGLGLDWPAPSWVEALAWLLVATTLLSILERALVYARLRSGRS
jgi:cardiolipin synthase